MKFFRRPYPRAIGITTVKVIALTLLSVLDLLFVAQYVPVKVHALVGTLVLLLVTFLFGEWIFRDTRSDVRRAAGIIIVTYVWETFTGLLLWSGIIGDATVLFQQTLSGHVIAFALHAAAMAAAYYDVQRLPTPKRKTSPEGLAG